VPGHAPTVSDCTEAELVGRIQAQLPQAPDWLVVGIGDDGAVVEPERNRLEVLSVDALVEGVHFDRRLTPPGAIGHRALAVNLSDLAAMGAKPRLALLSLVLPQDLTCSDFDAMISGLGALAAQHRLHLVGGNLTRSSGPLIIDVTVAGTCKRRQTLTRRGARPGDVLYVTGSIGAAAAGLQMLRLADANTGGGPPREEACVKSYLYPEPRVRLGLLLARNRAASACMDLSDGLADAVHGIAESSGVGAVIDAGALPIDAGARQWFEARGGDAVIEAMTLGDDYELAFAARPRWSGRLRVASRHGDAPLTRIGVCTAGPGVVLRRAGVDTPMPRGYRHFR
jgi:thiamine-monophosphate kinase